MPTITTFYKKTEPSQKEFELAVQEGILVYHTMKHNHSYRSMDCTAQLTTKLYEPKFTCARTKGEKAEELAAEIMVVIEKFSLENKVVAFSADNTNTNFGGLNRVGRVNVHTKVEKCTAAGEKCPVVLRRMFEDPLTELWLAFAHGSLAIFSETIKKLEGQDRCAVESAAILREVEVKLTARRDDSFIPVLARGLLGELVGNAVITRENFLKTAHSFFTTAVNYLQAWGMHTDNLNDLHCKKPLREEIQNATATQQEKCPNVKIKEDDLFDEVSALQEFLKGESLMKWREFETPLSQRWSTVFTHFKENDIPHTNLARLVSVVMCLPGSNAPVERVFSQMNDIWTDSRNRLTVPSIKAILIVKTNINLPCEKFMEMLAKDSAIQKKIHSSEKYAIFLMFSSALILPRLLRWMNEESVSSISSVFSCE
ncbi:hypothetical protein N1851_032481 [Merluccius polli]|uniref:HAT C-terminal dimerisation domain-containing protein n=1 Tax=Merluccius polli TaxID=89951 RepID=A0AA47M2R7_MERPO|nr:hypothetical protein N1851_032481 [Merluccius polli]